MHKKKPGVLTYNELKRLYEAEKKQNRDLRSEVNTYKTELQKLQKGE